MPGGDILGHPYNLTARSEFRFIFPKYVFVSKKKNPRSIYPGANVVENNCGRQLPAPWRIWAVSRTEIREIKGDAIF